MDSYEEIVQSLFIAGNFANRKEVFKYPVDALLIVWQRQFQAILSRYSDLNERNVLTAVWDTAFDFALIQRRDSATASGKVDGRMDCSFTAIFKVIRPGRLR